MRICVLSNGPAQKTKGVRVRELFEDLKHRHEVAFYYRDDEHRIVSTIRFYRAIQEAPPDVIFVEGVAYAGVLAATFGKAIHGSKVILSTGDAAYALAKSTMGAPKAWLVGVVEFLALRIADVIIAKGLCHKDMLERRGFKSVRWIPDGVDVRVFKPMDVSRRRQELGLQDKLTIGVVGNIVLNRKLEFCYGWETLEVLRLLPDPRVVGVVVGDGDGIPFLRRLSEEYGIAHRVLFTGWVEHDDLPEFINLIDVCISTQSNDLVGLVRTTAKLPEYLACGRFVIASDVGSASKFLADSGELIHHTALKDIAYVEALVRIVKRLCHNPALLKSGEKGVETAKRYFDYSVLRPALSRAIESGDDPAHEV